MINDATILVTGGTGSFGRRFIKMTLEEFNPRKIIIYSRDEMKQWEVAQAFENHRKLSFFQGDVRDKDRMRRAFNGVDYVIHAAALKIVPAAEYNPFEAIKTNVMGAMNVIDCAIDQNVRRVIALSTDKGCNPVNLYGATKLCSDKSFIAGNHYAGAQDTRFAVVRYGNVMGSRGSAIPFFISMAKKGEVPVTDERMTRFFLTLEDAVRMVWHALGDCIGGEIYVRKCPSMKIMDVVKTLAPKAAISTIGIRPGEKLHEQMIGPEDAMSTYEYDTYYKILPQIHGWANFDDSVRNGRPCADGFRYSSDTNPAWMSQETLLEWVKKEYDYDPLR